MNVKNTLAILALSCSIISWSEIQARPAIDKQSKPVMNKNSKLTKHAINLAEIGGAAKYCKEDPTVIDEFMDKAYSQLNAMAKDQYEKVFVRVEFKNLVTGFSVKKPKNSCKNSSLKLKDFLRKYK